MTDFNPVMQEASMPGCLSTFKKEKGTGKT